MEKYNDTVVIDENTYIEEYLPEDLEEDCGSDDIYYIDEDTGNVADIPVNAEIPLLAEQVPLCPQPNQLAEYLEAHGYCEIAPMEFYRNIFKEGCLSETAKDDDLYKRPGRVQTFVLAKEPKYQQYAETEHTVAFFNDLKNLNRAIQASVDKYEQLSRKGIYGKESVYITTITNACSYFKKGTKADSMYQLFALIVEIDDIKGAGEIDSSMKSCIGMGSLLRKLQNGDCPKPTYLVCSGMGIHLYYVFEKPIRLNRKYIRYQYESLNSYKKSLMKYIWTSDVSTSEPQVQGIAQKYRVVGTPTKYGSICRAFKFGGSVSLEYLNSFCEVLGCRPIIELYEKSKSQLYQNMEEAKENSSSTGDVKPNFGRKGTMHRNAFYSALARVCEQVKVGHRYFAVYCLAVTAKMCSIPYEELEKIILKDGLMDVLNSIEGAENNQFTVEEAQKALHAYYFNEYFMKRETFEEWTGVKLPEPVKRSGRKRKDHMKYMQEARKEKRAKGEIVDGGGRPLKWWPTFAYRLVCPEGEKTACMKYSGLSRRTVDKYWGLYDNVKNQLPDLLAGLTESIKSHTWGEILAGDIELKNVPSKPASIKGYTEACLKKYGLLELGKNK